MRLQEPLVTPDTGPVRDSSGNAERAEWVAPALEKLSVSVTSMVDNTGGDGGNSAS